MAQHSARLPVLDGPILHELCKRSLVNNCRRMFRSCNNYGKIATIGSFAYCRLSATPSQVRTGATEIVYTSKRFT